MHITTNSQLRHKIFNTTMARQMAVLGLCLLVTVYADMGVGGMHSGMGRSHDYAKEPKCEEINIPMCRAIGYNMTSYPNDMNHENQDDAGLEVHQFWPLVEIDCSPDLKFFLCSKYAPICLEDYHKPLPVCRTVCQRARDGCEPLMKRYSFAWPEKMSCEDLPMYGDPDNLCMEQPDYISNEQGGSRGGGSGSGGSMGGHYPDSPSGGKNSGTTRKQPGSSSSGGSAKGESNKCKGKNSKNCQSAPGERKKECGCSCRSPLIPLGKEMMWHASTSVARVGSVQNCAMPCKGAFFTHEEKDFVGIWIALWSGLCCVSTLMTLSTFLIDTERFKYPERPIVFLSACYFMVSVGYLIRVFLGHEEVACDGRAIKYMSTGPSSCTLVFLLIYFFGMASSVWWVVLSFTWFLSAGLKWGNEVIAKHSQYFHMAAWLIPSVQSIAVLSLQAVDGDPVSGICYVGNLSTENLRTFVLAPLFVYLVVGTTFLMAGFVSLFRIRSVIKQEGGLGAVSKADKLERLMIRIGIFSVLYTVPATIVIGCYLYEASFHDDWSNGLTCPCLTMERHREQPLYSVLMLKYFMALAVGITSGVWIWSGKTLDSWRRFWRRCLGIPTGTNGMMTQGSANQTLLQKRPPIPQPYLGAGVCGGGGGGQNSATASLLTTPYTHGGGSVASTSHHHLHHHVLKQTPMSHV